MLPVDLLTLIGDFSGDYYHTLEFTFTSSGCIEDVWVVDREDRELRDPLQKEDWVPITLEGTMAMSADSMFRLTYKPLAWYAPFEKEVRNMRMYFEEIGNYSLYEACFLQDR